MPCKTVFMGVVALLLTLGVNFCVGMSVFTESARFERLSHFKDAGLVHHLNTVDQAMIADGIYRMFKTNESTFEDGYALWKNREVTQMINDQTKNLPSTDGPSHFILTAHKVLPNVFPSENATSDDGYSCWGGKHSITDMSNAMYNWHRALCATDADPSWNGVYDPAYMPQQMALTSGFMCILACDCNRRETMTGESLARFASSSAEAAGARDSVCQLLPWGRVNFHDAASDTDELARLAEPLIKLGPCNSCK